MHRLPLIEASLRNLSGLLCNAIGCLLLCGLGYFVWIWTAFPMTIDIIWQLIVTEISLWRTRRRLARYLDRTSAGRETRKACKGQDLGSPSKKACDDLIIDTIGVVVGWREDEELFEACIRSYKAAQGCKFLIVGVDGDSAEDMVMVNTYEKVYSDSPLVIHFKRPLGEILESYESDSRRDLLAANEKECNTDSLQVLCNYVKNVLEEQLFPGLLESTRNICIYQPHRSKKDILFSAFLVSLIVGEKLGIEYVWGSDSDTVVFPDSIQKAVRLIHADKQAGGASARLKMVNKNPTIVSKMIAAKYWFEQDVSREQTAACKASECQPGPCAAFRLISLKEIIVPWYQQIIFGKRMIANEDRHLTTNLLHRGWHVHYAPDAFVLTDAPSTVLQWVKQQVRWGRGTHIERVERPMIYVKKCPIFFFHVWREEVLPIFAGYYIIGYLIRRQMSSSISGKDLITRVLLQFVYTLLRSHEPVSRDHIIWLLPSLLFHSLPGPGIHLWSLLTVFESSWGTTMRGSVAPPGKEKVRERWYQVGFHVIWMTVVAGFCAKLVSTVLAVHTGLTLSVWFLPGVMVISGPLIYWSIFGDLHLIRK